MIDIMPGIEHRPHLQRRSRDDLTAGAGSSALSRYYEARTVFALPTGRYSPYVPVLRYMIMRVCVQLGQQ